MKLEIKKVELVRKSRITDAAPVALLVWAIMFEGRVVGYSFNPDDLLEKKA
jgi:hypothetical protein